MSFQFSARRAASLFVDKVDGLCADEIETRSQKTQITIHALAIQCGKSDAEAETLTRDFRAWVERFIQNRGVWS